MYIADTLSRAYIPGEPSVHAVALAKMDMTEGLSVSHRRLEELRAATGKWLCSPETDAGNYERLACTEVRQRPTHLCVLQCATWTDRAEWTRVHRLQDRITDQLTHEHHRRGTSLASEITDYVSQCSMCNMPRPEQCKEPMAPHVVPGRPWANVAADLFELQGQHYLLLVDYFSNFFELMRLSSSTWTKCVIDAMRSCVMECPK